MSTSTKIFIWLIITLAILSFINVFLPQGNLMPGKLPASKPIVGLVSAVSILIIYGGLGFIGLKLSEKLGWAKIWDRKLTNRQRFLTPAIVGVALGILLIIVDTVASRYNPLGALPHPVFPTSMVASITAGIGEETIFRLFFVSFWVWLISYVILRKKYQAQVFWIVSFFSAMAFAFGHVPSLLILYNINISQMPAELWAEIIFLNGVISFFCAYYLRKYGFLAAVGIHFWTDVVWHVIFGLV
jgi:hypothetical protein